MTTNDTIRLIAKWINESVPAGDIDRLIDHIHAEHLNTNEEYIVGERLLHAIKGEE